MTILVEPTVTLRPLGGETVAHFARVYGEIEHPLVEAKGFDLVGAWATASGSVGRVVHLYRFDDFTAYDGSRRSIRSDPEFLPKIMAAYGPDLTIRETVVCGQPLPHVQLDRAKELGPDNEDTMYARVSLTAEFAGLDRIVPMLAQVHGQIEAATSMQLVAAYLPVFGDRNQIVIYWRLPEGLASLGAAAAAADPDLLAKFRGLVSDEAFELMRSLPYSPTAG